MDKNDIIDLQKAVETLIASDGDNKNFQIENILTTRKNSGEKVKNFDTAVETALKFFAQEKTADAARHTGNLGRSIEGKQNAAAQALGTFLTDKSLSEDIRRTATVELGSIASKMNAALVTYDAEMDNSPNVAAIKNMFSMLKEGVYPQVARYIGPIVMDTKSPTITSEGLKILLESTDEQSADFLDKILDTKEGYVLQKLRALTNAVVETGPENISPEITQSISDYLLVVAPHIEHRLQKDVEEIGLTTKAFRVLAKHGYYPEDVALEQRKLFHSLNSIVGISDPEDDNTADQQAITPEN